MKKLLFVLALLAAVVVAAPAQAAYMTGGMSIASQPGGSGLNSFWPVDATGAQVQLGSATGLDFTTTGGLTPGVGGLFRVDSTQGSFNPLWNKEGTINDFTFAGLLTPPAGYPNPPVTGFEVLNSGGSTPFAFSFDLLTIGVTEQSPNLITLKGKGTFFMTGFDPTPGMLYFSANEAGDTLTFSASEAPIPEPGSMLLLGTGLFGLAGAVRRRLKK
jgi:hypothetical protein